MRGSYVKYDVDSGQLNSYTKKFSLCHRINKAFYVVSVKVVVQPLPVTVKYKFTYKGILASDIAIRREGTQHTFFSGYVLSKMLSRLTLPVECVGFIAFETQTLVQESYKEARCAHFCGFVSLTLKSWVKYI